MAVFDEKAKQLAERAAAAMAAAAAQPAPTAGSAASKKKKRKEKQIEKKLEKMNERRVPSISNTKDNKVKVPKGKPASTSKPQDIKDRTMSSDEARLLREIKLLGGTETDLHLIQDIDSGSEIGDDADAASSKMSNAQMADDDVEIAKALKDFMAKSLKLDPKKSLVPVVTEAEADAEEAYNDLDSEKDHGEEFDDENDDEEEEKEYEDSRAAVLATPIAIEAPQQKKAAQQTQKSDPAVAKRIDALLASKTFDSAAVGEKLLFEPVTMWYAVELAPVRAPTVYTATDELLILKMYEKAKALFAEEVKRFEKVKFQSSSDRNFMKTVLKSGTTTDKISALTLLIQESPLHTLHYLRDQIIHGMARKKSRRDALVAVDAVKDLLTSGGVLPDRKLRYFRDQGVLSPGVEPVHLIVWYFEDALKRVYFEFLQLIEELSKDSLNHIKSKILTYITFLLCAKPEQEAALLSLLVNKLGDSTSTLAFKAAHLMQGTLLTQHPNMKPVVVREVERLMARSVGNSRARYAALAFLSQMALRRGVDAAVAKDLVGIYFGVFEAIVEQMGRGASSEGAAGKKGQDEKKKGKGKKGRYTRGHVGHKRKGKPMTAEEAVKLGGEEAGGDSEDEAEAAEGTEELKKAAPRPEQVVDGLDAKTMAVLLTGVNRAFPYAEMEDDLFDKHMNTLFKISHLGTFNISIQALTLIFQVHSSRQTISDRFYRSLYETLIDPRLPGCSKHPMYLNLLHRAMKADTSLTRSRAFIKRLVQTCGMSNTPFICGSLFLIGDILKIKPGLWSLVTMGEEDADGLETFVDVDEEGGEARKPAGAAAVEVKRYDGKKRDPLYCNADISCLWELTLFTNHFHPTVALYAETLLSGNPIQIPASATAYDPLQNHTLARFLDRFVFKNPKKVTSAYRGSSLMQPRPPGMSGGAFDAETGAATGNLIAGARKRGVVLEEEGEDKVAMDDDPVNSGAYLNRGREKIPVDELFFYDYFTEKKARSSTLKKKKGKSSDDVDTFGEVADSEDGDAIDDGDDVGDADEPADDANDLEEDEIWSAMQRSVQSANPDDAKNDDEEEFDMEAAMKEAEVAFSKRKEEGSDDEDEFEGDEAEFGEEDFAAFEAGLPGGDDDDDEDAYEDVEDDDEEVILVPPVKSKKGKKVADNDKDGLIGEDADEELASMFVDDDGSDDEGGDDEEEAKKGAKKVGKPKAGKIQKLASVAKDLGYKGDFFSRKLGKAKGDAGDDLDIGSGFASIDDFMDLIERDDEDEDDGTFSSSKGGNKAAGPATTGKRKSSRGKQKTPPSKKFKRR